MVSKEEEGIRHFLKEYIVELTARDTDPSRVKNLRRKFFIERYNKKWGIPSYGKIANETIRYLIKLGKIRNVGEIEKIVAGCPFLKYYIRNFSDFEEDLKPSKVEPQLTVEDLRRIKQKEHLGEVEDQLRERVVQEKVDAISEETKKRILDLEEQKKRKEEEYYSLPSVLDESEFEEPAPQIENKKSEEKWWHILGLKKDPFPTQEGLSRIPEKLFEKVVVKTNIFQDYLDRIEKGGEDILNKGTLIIGEFGGGKTTFFDYLTVHLIDKKIKPIRLTMDAFNDVYTYHANFDTQLFREVNEFCRGRIGYTVPGSPSRESILEIMRELRQRQGWRFLIILDDLHKHCGEDIVMKFLSSLQIFKDYLVRRNIDVGFMVSGLPNWEGYLKKEEAFGGFIDAIEYIPRAEPKIAYDIIKNRLEAYALNPKKCNAIDIKFIEKVYRKTVHEGSFRGYRTFIRHIIDEFKRGNFDILEVPIKIAPDTLESIRAIIEENEKLKKAFNKFIFGKIEHEVNRERGLECLIRIYLSEGIIEGDPYFKENGYHFDKLTNAGLIQKSKIGESQFKWRVTKDLVDANKKILKKFNLSLEDYLVKLYIKTPTKREKKTLRGREKEIINKFLKKNADLLGSAVSGLLKSSFEIYNEISGFDQSNFPPLIKFIDDCKRSLAYLSKALFTYEKIVKIPEQDDDVLKLWETYWVYPSAVAHFRSQFFHTSVLCIDSKEIKEKIATMRVDFKEAYTELFDFFKEQIELEERAFSIPLGDLTREEIKIFHEVRKIFVEERTEDKKFDMIRMLNENIEQKLRSFLFVSLHLLYGNIDQRLNKIGDSSITEYITRDGKVRSHPSFNEWTYNEFEKMNRGQYKLLIQNNPCVRDRIFGHVLQNFPDLSTFLEIFCEKNISTSHLKKQEISCDEPSSVLYYILRGSDFIKRLNSTYYKFLSEYAYRKIEDSDRRYFFSLENIKTSKKDKGKQKKDRRKQIYDLEAEMPKDFSELTPVRVKDEEKKRIIRQLIDLTKSNSSGFYNLNLERYDELVRLFNIEYRKLIAILAEIYQEGKINTEKLYGPEIRIAFTQKR